MTKNIYILTGGVYYEGSHIIAAFNNQEDAELLAEKCREHDKLKPVCLRERDHQSNVLADARNEWHTSLAVWKDNHPSGSAYYNYYEVEEIELK